ncbi:type II toxin-antitoxin system HicA family toxin [Helicobacter suis]|uniref:Addiction module toxin, HicA family n=1 Tax=Helicobacter suis TaxID=104628 RepID=A0A6J4CZM6_9HELI|nr:type II toxin-antitoxin system HicA family toxin [Helicobacter suis]BCD46319.1 Addiction module toxin, HicA family [Helicobacter suis]BCD47767.1 Addiction module toxin, HicA family [Helicobacter suis]BCD49525.1 Addiction module toxin, HicA family [Helicobacter suis]BCD51562.1 Addiction module toxin, HicA family [Helicobacter suis]BCD70655.1 Addiction module toxin, HicA family [Helicobacter suis]
MADLPRLTAKEAERLLLQNGFTLARQKGSHKIYIKGKIRQVLPFHSGKILHPL